MTLVALVGPKKSSVTSCVKYYCSGDSCEKFIRFLFQNGEVHF